MQGKGFLLYSATVAIIILMTAMLQFYVESERTKVLNPDPLTVDPCGLLCGLPPFSIG